MAVSIASRASGEGRSDVRCSSAAIAFLAVLAGVGAFVVPAEASESSYVEVQRFFPDPDLRARQLAENPHRHPAVRVAADGDWMVAMTTPPDSFPFPNPTVVLYQRSAEGIWLERQVLTDAEWPTAGAVLSGDDLLLCCSARHTPSIAQAYRRTAGDTWELSQTIEMPFEEVRFFDLPILVGHGPVALLGQPDPRPTLVDPNWDPVLVLELGADGIWRFTGEIPGSFNASLDLAVSDRWAILGSTEIYGRTADGGWEYHSDVPIGSADVRLGATVEGDTIYVPRNVGDGNIFGNNRVDVLELDSAGVWTVIQSISCPASCITQSGGSIGGVEFLDNVEFGATIVANGGALFIAAPYDDELTTDSGAIFVYERAAEGEYVYLEKLTPSESWPQAWFPKPLVFTGRDIIAYQSLSVPEFANGIWFYVFAQVPPVHPHAGLVDPTQGRWYLGSRSPSDAFFFGNPGDQPIVGDWDCDGVDTPGMYRRLDGFVYLSNANRSQIADRRFFFGDPGDLPLAGDFDGDGCDSVSLYRPSEGRVFIINELGSEGTGLGAASVDYYFGNPGDKPFVGDFNGDGVETVGLHRESTGLVYFSNAHRSQVADSQFIYGDPGDRLVAGDWSGSGIDSPGIYRPDTASFYLRYANAPGVADQVFPFGEGDWLPVAGVFGG